LPAGDYPLIAIVGPTGAGKSALAISLALELGGEIVNCDSVQVYRYFNIGAAKLTASEQRGVPHHLMDIVEPDELFTAGEYARRARDVLTEISGRGRIPIVVGGTGFYLNALLHGLFARLFTKGSEPLRGYDLLTIGLDPPRASLYRAIDERVRRMFSAGLVEEAQSILNRNYPPMCKPFQSLGYSQVVEFLDKKLTIAQAVEEVQKQTRRYAKRQWTWFRRDKKVSWIEGFGPDPEVLARALSLARQRFS
jgi:tRNA dimethylallyltransferase